MLRTAMTLMLAGLQAVLAAPLYICTSAQGDLSLDGGLALCAVSHLPGTQHEHHGCCSQPDESPRPAPCDCRHEALGVDVQQVRRAESVPSGGLLVTSLAIIDLYPVRPWANAFDCSASVPPATHLPISDWGSVCLRC